MQAADEHRADESGEDERPKYLLLIEDDPTLGPLMAKALGKVFDVELKIDGREGLDRALSGDFDVMVVDRRLPLMDGVALVQELRRRRVVTPILMLTALGTLENKVEGLDAGANDYLVKPFDYEELFARLRALTRTFDERGVAIPINDYVLYPDDGFIHSPYLGRILLTPREASLLQLLAEHPDRVFSREQILRAVFRKDDQPGTVDTYVHYVRNKTDRDIILTVRRRGYRLGQM